MKPSSIVAIGFSAGGLAPLKTFFDHTPLDDTAYIVITHLPPDYHSELQGILQRHSRLKIVEAKTNAVLSANNVYVMKQGCYVKVEKDLLHLIPRGDAYPNHAIDILLESLAVHQPAKIAAVILSGAGSDGTKGIAFIKAVNGIVIVQQPASCQCQWMPMNAILSGHVDHVLLPGDMPVQLMEWNKQLT